MFRKFTKATILLTVLALLFTMGAVYASAEEETTAPVLDVQRVDNTGTVFYTGGNFVPAFCYNIANYDELTAYYGAAPVWSVAFSEGGENYFSFNDQQGDWLRVDFCGSNVEPAEVTIDVQCTVGDQVFTDTQAVVIREHPMGALESLNFPTIIDGVAGVEQQLDVSGIMPEGWLEDGVDYVLHCNTNSSGVEIYHTDAALTVTAAESGFYEMYLQVECSTYFLTQYFAYRVADAQGNVPELPLSLTCSSSASEPITLYTGGTESGLSLASIVPEWQHMQALLREGTPEWTVTCTSGDESLIRCDVLTDGVEFYLQTAADQPQTVSFDVTCSWGGETAQRTLTINVVEPDFDAPSCLLPDEMTFDLGEERAIPLADMFSTDGLDETVWPVNRWMNANFSALDYVIDEDQMVVRALTPGIYQAEFCMDYANYRIEKRVLVYIRDAEGNLPTIPQPVVSVMQHYDTLYTNGNTYPVLATVTVDNLGDLQSNYGYSDYYLSIIDYQGDGIFYVENNQLRMNGQPSVPGTATVTLQIHVDHPQNDALDLYETREFAFEIIQAADMNQTIRQVDPVHMQLGETIDVTPAYLLPADCGISEEKVSINGIDNFAGGSYSLESSSVLSLTSCNPGPFRSCISLTAANLDFSVYLPVLVAYEDGTPAQLPVIELDKNVTCDLIFTQRQQWASLISVRLHNFDQLVQFYGTYPQWDIIVENDADNFVSWNQHDQGVDFDMCNSPWTVADVTLSVTCTIGGESASVSHVITVSDQGREDFCGVNLPSYIQAYPGEEFPLDAMAMLADPSWTLPVGTPEVTLHGDEDVVLTSSNGAVSTWACTESGVHRMGMRWTWGNFITERTVDIIIADADGVFPIIEPEPFTALYSANVYTAGNASANIGDFLLNNYDLLCDLYVIDGITWNLVMTDDCGAELSLQPQMYSAYLFLNGNPSRAGTLSGEVQATIDFSDDSLNTTISYPFTYTAVDPGLTYPSEPVQLPDVTVNIGEQFAVDTKQLLSEEALATLAQVNYSWPHQHESVSIIEMNNGEIQACAGESGVYRMDLRLFDSNVSVDGYVDVYVCGEDGTVPAKPVLEFNETVHNTTFYAKVYREIELLTLSIPNINALRRYLGADLIWEQEMSNNDNGAVNIIDRSTDDTFILSVSLWNTPLEAHDNTLNLTFRLGKETIEYEKTLHCVDLGPYVMNAVYFGGPFDLQINEPVEIALADLLPPGLDYTSETFSIYQSSGTEYAQICGQSADTLSLMPIQSGLGVVTFNWTAANASNSVSAVLRIADESGVLPELPAASLTESVLFDRLYVNGGNYCRLFTYTIGNAEALYQLYGTYPTWNVTIDDPLGSSAVWYGTEGSWNETLYFHYNNTPEQETSVTVNVTVSIGPSTFTASRTVPVVDIGLRMYDDHTIEPRQAQMNEPLIMSLSDILPAGVDSSYLTECQVEAIENTHLYDFVSNGNELIFTPHSSGAYSAVVRVVISNIAFDVRVPLLVADETGVYPELPDFTVEKTGLIDTIYVGGDQPIELVRYRIEDMDVLGPVYGMAEWHLNVSDEAGNCIYQATCDDWSAGMYAYVGTAPTQSGTVTLDVTCKLGDHRYSDSYTVTILDNPGIESGTELDFGEVATQEGQIITIPLTSLLPEGVDPNTANFNLVQVSGTEYAELTSYENGEAVFAIHKSAVIGMRLNWSIANIGGVTTITFIAKDSEDNVPTVPEFFLAEDVFCSAMYIGGTYNSTLISYELANAEAYYAYTGAYPDWSWSSEGDNSCLLSYNLEGDYNQRLVIRSCCAPGEICDITVSVSCDYAGQSDAFTQTISVIEQPSVSMYDSMTYGPFDLSLNEDTELPIDQLIPQGIDSGRTLVRFSLEDEHYVSLKATSRETITVNGAVPGYTKVRFHWSSSNYAGYSDIIFRIADENGVYPEYPTFSVTKELINDTLYIGSYDSVYLAEYTVPGASGLAALEGIYLNWEVSVNNDPDCVVAHTYDGNYNGTLRLFMMNVPYNTGEINVTVTCTAGEETYTDTLTISVAQGPDEYAPLYGINEYIQAQEGQTFSIDARIVCGDEWSLPTGSPRIVITGENSDCFEYVGAEGSINTWRATKAGAYSVSYLWQWANYQHSSQMVILVADENGNNPAIAPDISISDEAPLIYVNGNYARSLSTLHFVNHDTYNALYSINSVTWDLSLDTDTGLTLSKSGWDAGYTIAILNQPTQTGTATVNVTITVDTEDPAGCFSQTFPVEITVDDLGAETPPLSHLIRTIDAVPGDTFKVYKSDILDSRYGIHPDQLSINGYNYSGMWMSENYDDYDTFVIDQSEGLCSVVYNWEYANFHGRACVMVRLPDGNGEVPPTPVMEVTRTEHGNTIYLNGNSSYTDLFTYHVADAEALTALNGGCTPEWTMYLNGVSFLNCMSEGEYNSTLEITSWDYPREAGEYNIIVTCNAGPYSQVYNEVIYVKDGPATVPDGLAAGKLIRAQVGQTFSIDASALSDGWTLEGGTAHLNMQSDAENFEFIGHEGSVFTWRALNSGMFMPTFTWSWANYQREISLYLAVADESGVYPSTEPEFNTQQHADTLYVNGPMLNSIARVVFTNYDQLVDMMGYQSVNWYIESIEGAPINACLINDSITEARIDLNSQPSEAGTSTINLVCAIDSIYDEYDQTCRIPLTYTIADIPEDMVYQHTVMDYVYLPLNETVVVNKQDFVPAWLRGHANADGWIGSWDYGVDIIEQTEYTYTLQGTESGVRIINGHWNASNLTGHTNLVVLVADENGVYPEEPRLEIVTEVLEDTFYIGGNTDHVPLATFTLPHVHKVNEAYGGNGFEWVVSCNGNEEGIIGHEVHVNGEGASVLTLYSHNYPSYAHDIEVTVTGQVGFYQTSSAMTVHVVQGPETMPDALTASSIIHMQVGELFSVDAASINNGWSLPTGAPTLQMNSCQEQFELVSVEGSVYTWRALGSGAFAPQFDWRWNSYVMYPDIILVVADENGVEPVVSPAFSTHAATPTLYVGGSHSVCLAEVFLDNYALLDALYGIDALTWTINCSTLDIHDGNDTTRAYAYLSSAPTEAGTALVEFFCEFDFADDSMNTTYAIPMSITVEDAPFAIPETYREMGDFIVGMGEGFNISFASVRPDELADYTGDVVYWMNRYSPALSEVYETEDSYVITAYNSGVYFADIFWRCANVSGIARYYLLVADEEGNVPQRPALNVTENVQTNMIYTGGVNLIDIATYTIENAEVLTALYDAMPSWQFSAASDLLSYRISGDYNEVLTVCMNGWPNNVEDIQYTVTSNVDRESAVFENILTVAELPEGDWPTAFADGKNIVAQTGETFTIDASALENGWSLPAGTPTLNLWCANAEFELVERNGSLHTFRAPASGVYTVDCTINWLNCQIVFTANILVADENGTVPSVDPVFDEWTQGILFANGNLNCHLTKLHLQNEAALNSLYNLQSVTYSVANISHEGVDISIMPTDYWTYFTLNGQPSTTGTLTFDVLCTLDAADDANDQVITRSYAIPIEENPGLDLSIPFDCGGHLLLPGESTTIINSHIIPSELYSYLDSFSAGLESWTDHASYLDSESSEGNWIFIAEKPGIGTVRFSWICGNLYGYSNLHLMNADESGVYPEVPAISDTETVYVETLHTGMDFSGDIVTFTLNDAAALVDYYSTPITWEPLIYGDDENLIGYTISGANKENCTFYLTRMPSEACNITMNVMCYIGHTNLSLHQALNIYTGPGTLPTGLAVEEPFIVKVGQTFSLDAAALNDGWTLSFGTPALSLLSEENFRLVSTEGSVYTYEALSTGGFTENLDWQWTNYHTSFPLSIIVTDETGSITPVEPVIDVLPRFTLDDESILLYAGDGDSMAIADLAVSNADDLYLNSVTWTIDSCSDPAMGLQLISPDNGATGYIMLDRAPANVGSDVITLRCIIDSLVDDFDSEHTIEVPVTVLDNPLNVADDYYLGDITLPYGSSFEINLADVIPADLGEEACALGTADLNGYSVKLNLDSNDGQIQSWSAREPGVYRVEFFWRVSNTYGVSHFDVYAADEDGTTLAMPTIDGYVVAHDEGTIYTGGNLSAPVVEVVIPDYHRFYDYWGEHPEISVNCNWGTNDAIGYTQSGDPYSVAFVGNNVPVAEVLDQLVTISFRGETREYACTVTVAEVPSPAPDSVANQYIVANPGAAFSIDARQILDGWTLPTGEPTMIMQVGGCELLSEENGVYTWRAPEEPGAHRLFIDLSWANYYFPVSGTLFVTDENGAVAQPDVRFMNDVMCTPLYIGGNYHTMPVALFHVAWDQIESLKETYGYDQIRWEIDGYSNLGANFRLYTEDDGGQIFLVDQPTEVGEITIDMNCILDSANDALDFVIPTSVTIQTAEWTGGDYTIPVEYGVAEITVGETFNLDMLSLVPQGVEYIEEVWHPLPSNHGIEVVSFDNYVLSLAGKLPGIYPLPLNWGMENITGTINVELHVLDENGNLPPQWDITETLALDNTLYIGGHYGVDLINLTVENAQAVAEYAGEIVWNVEYEGDPDYILRGYTSGDYGENFLVTTEMVCQTPSDITVHITCTAGSMGTIFDRSYPVRVAQGPETEPVITLDDTLTTQLGQTFTLDAAALAGDWTLPTGQPWLTCKSDKIELVAFDGTSFTFRALESGVFQAGFTWHWSTYRAYDYIDFIVYNEDGTLPLIEPDLYQHAWVDVHYAGGNSLRNTVSIFVENFNALQELYGYGEPTWTITSSTGYEEYFTTSTYNGSSCSIALAKAPEAAASFELEVTGVFDAADDQYDQTVTVNVPITFGVVENLPEIPETLELDLNFCRIGDQFGFGATDILPAGFSLPTGEIDIQTFDSFDMHDQQYTADGSFLYTAQQSGSFRMYVSWVWENFQGSAEVLLYVEPDNTNTNFDFYETDDVIHTVFTNGDVPDSHRVHLNEDMMEAYQATPVWSLKHVYGTAYDYSLNVDADSFGATVAAASIPSYEGYGIYELSCTWGDETYTQPLYITSTTSYVKPTHLDLPDEVTLAYTDEPYVFNAYSAAIEGYDGLYESEAAQRLYVESASCELWVGYDYELTHIKPLSTGVQTVRLRWECGNLVLYKDVVFKMLDENGELPPQWSIEETIHDDTIYIGGGYGFDLLELELINGPALSEYAGTIYWAVTYEGNSDNVLIKGVGGECGERMVISTEILPASPVDDITAHISCQVGSMGEIFSKSYVIHVVEGTYTMPTVNAPTSVTTQLGSTFTIDAASLVGDWSLSTGSPRILFFSDKIEHVSSEGSLHTFRALESGVLDGGFVWRWNTYLSGGNFDLIVCNEDGSLPTVEAEIVESVYEDTLYVGGNSLCSTHSFYVQNIEALQKLYGMSAPQWSFTSNTGYEEFFLLSANDGNCHIILDKQPDHAASFELEITAVFDAEDDQYDQTVVLTTPVTFAEAEGMASLVKENSIDLGVSYVGGTFSFTDEDILPDGFTLPTGEPQCWLYTGFDMHIRKDSDAGTYCFEAGSDGYFSMIASWYWANFSASTNVLLYVEPDNRDANFDFNTNTSNNRVIFTNGNDIDSYEVWLNGAMMEAYQSTPVWKLEHAFGDEFGTTLRVIEDGLVAIVETTSLPAHEGYGCYELSCTWGAETYTQAVYICAVTPDQLPAYLDLPDEVTLSCTGEAYAFNACRAMAEGAEETWHPEYTQRLSIVESSCELWVGYDYEMIHILPQVPGIQNVRLKWTCGNLVLYKDVVFRMLDENGELPVTAPIVERVDQCDIAYVGGNKPVVFSSFYLTNLGQISELYGYQDVIWTITSAEGYESYFDLEDLGDEVHLNLDKQPDFEGSFELVLTGLLDATDDQFDQTVSFTIPVTFAPRVDAPARSKTLPAIVMYLGETFTVSRSDILPANWSLPTGQSQCYQASDETRIKLLSDTEEGMTFQPQEAGMFELLIWWEWGNFGGTTYVPVYVRPAYSADFGVGTETAFERTLLLEGNILDVQSFHVVTNDTVIEGTPVWSLTHMYGPDMGYTAQTSADGHEFVISAAELPSRTGTVIMELTCAWGDTAHVIPLVFHVVSAPDGMPTDVNLPDTITTKVGETVTLSPAVLPDGWSVEGVAQKLTTIAADETLFHNDNYADGTISVVPNEAGIKKITVQWSCANIVLTKEITLRIAREDGMMPPTDMLLAYSNDQVNHYFIHEGAATDFKQVWLSNFDEIQSFYGGTPEWTLTPMSGRTALTTSLDEYGTYLTISMADLPTADDAVIYRLDCTWGDLSLSKDFTLYIHNSYVPTEQTLEPLYRMQIGDTLTITLDDVMGDEEFVNYGADEGFSLFSIDDAFNACFDVVRTGNTECTITAKASTFGSFIVNWSCGNLLISGEMAIVVADENGVYPETDMVVESTRPVEQTFYVGGTYTHATRFDTVNYNDLFGQYGSEAEWTLTQLSGNTVLTLHTSDFISASGCSVNLASAPTEPDTITFQVSCDWNGATSYLSEVYTIHVVEPECALPTSLSAEAVYFAEVGETVTLSAGGLRPEGWTHTENDPYIYLAGVNSNFTSATTSEHLANGDVAITAVTPGLHKFEISWYDGNVVARTVAHFAIPDENGVVEGLTFKGFNNFDENSTYYIGGNSVEICGFYMTNADELKRIYGSDFRPEWSFEVTSGGDLVELYTDMTDDETGFFVLRKDDLSKTGILTYTVTCSAEGHVLKTWNMTANIVESPTGLPAEIITPEKIIVNLGDTLTFGPATVVSEDWTAPEGAMVLGGVNDDSVLADAFEFAYESDGTGHYTALTPGIYDVNLYWRMNNHMLYKDVTIYVCYEDGTVPVPVIELYNEFGDTYNLYIGGNHNLANVFYINDYQTLYQKYGGTPEWTVTQTSGEYVGAYFVPYEYSEDMYQMFLSKTSSRAESVELQVEVRWGDAVGTFTQTITFSEPDFNMPTGFITPELVELKVGETLSLPECPVNTEGLDYDDWGFGRVTDDWFNENFTYVDYVEGCELYLAEASGVTSITFEWRYRNYLLSQDMLVIVLEEDGTRPIPELKTTREDVQTDFSVGDEPTLIASVTLSDEVFEAYSQHVSTKPTWSAFWVGDHKVQLQHREDRRGMDVYLTEAPATIGTTEISVFMTWLGVTTQDTITIRVTETMPEVAIRAERFLLLQGMSCQVDLTGDLTGWTTAWSTSDDEIATVDENGVVTAVAPGLTFVTLDLTTPAGSSKHLVVAVEVLTDVFTMALPAALTEIEDEAFWGTAAGYIVLPYGVTTIGESAFANAPNLKLVLIPATVTGIPDSILDGTSAAILCDPGSDAEAFAIENEIPYYFVK